MESIFMWLGFIGAWLLFAGPIYQAALELKDEDIEIDRIRAAGSKIETPAKVSAWWWLLPPVKFYKELQRGKTSRNRILTVLSTEDIEAMLSFNSKASAWFLVATGGLCIASKESYELAEHNHWSTATLLIIIIGIVSLSIANVAYRLRRAEAVKNFQS